MSIDIAEPVPASDPNSLPFDQLHEAIQADILAAIKRSKESTLRQELEREEAEKKKAKPMKLFSETYDEAVRAIRAADGSLSLEQAHEKATLKTMTEARSVKFVTLGDPSTDPTPLPPAQQEQYDAVDETLLAASVTAAIKTSVTNAPRPAKPEFGANYAAAIQAIATSVPPMSQDAAMALARAAKKKDREIQIAREAVVANPQPNNAWSEAGN